MVCDPTASRRIGAVGNATLLILHAEVNETLEIQTVASLDMAANCSASDLELITAQGT